MMIFDWEIHRFRGCEKIRLDVPSLHRECLLRVLVRPVRTTLYLNLGASAVQAPTARCLNEVKALGVLSISQGNTHPANV